jgi:hypothetical protein
MEGEIVEYNAAVPEPHQAQIAPMPNYVTNFTDELIRDFRDAGGQREASVAPPPSLTAGVALQVSAELADEIIGPILKRMSRSMSLVANQQLLLMHEEWTEPRRIIVLGEGDRARVEWLQATDFKNATDVYIEVESLFPDFRGAKQQRLFDLWDRRIIQDPKTFLRALRYGTFDMLMEEEEKAQDRVYLDIQKIKRGKTPEITPFDNHVLYVKELSKFIQTPEFLKLIPERKQLAIQAMQSHLGALMQNLPNQGEVAPQQNQAAVGSPFGPVVPQAQ